MQLEPRVCLSSWFAALADSDVHPTAIAQYDNAAQVAVLGSVERIENGSRYDDGVALQITPTGRTAREALLSIDPSLPLPSEVSTRLNDAEFDSSGRLLVIGSSASSNALVDTRPLSRAMGEPSVWNGFFNSGFTVVGLGFPEGVDKQGDFKALSLRNGGISVGDFGTMAAYSIDCGVPILITHDGQPVLGLAPATNGNRLLVSEVLSSLSFVYDITATGELINRTQLERPDGVFRVFGTSISDNGWMSGFGQVYDLETGDITSTTLVWQPDGTLAERIDFAGQRVESRIVVDGAAFFDVTPVLDPLGKEGSYVYLIGSDTFMPVTDWVQSLGITIPDFTLNDGQKVVDAEWSSNGQWLNLLVDSTNGAPDFVIHLEGLSFAPGDGRPRITAPASITSQLRPTFTWNAVPGRTDYEIWIRNRSTGQDRLIVQPVSETTFTPSSDLGIGLYSVWVRALGTSGSANSAWSPQYNFRINTRVTLNDVAPNQTTSRPEISWQPLPGAVHYDIWIDRLDTNTPQFIRNTGLSDTRFVPTTDMPIGRYRVWVRGLDAAGVAGSCSESADFRVNPVPIITGGLNPTFDTSPTITWNAIAGASQYEVYVLRLQGNVRVLHQTGITNTSFTLPTLTPGPYRYWVKVSGSSAWSNPVEIDLSGRTTMLTPIGTGSNSRPLISWRPVDGAGRYELWVNQLGVREKIIYRTNLTSSSFTPSSGLPKGNYRVWVRAVNSLESNLVSPWSASVDFTIAATDHPAHAPSGDESLVWLFSDSRLLPLLGTSGPMSLMTSHPVTPVPVTQPIAPETFHDSERRGRMLDEQEADWNPVAADFVGIRSTTETAFDAETAGLSTSCFQTDEIKSLLKNETHRKS